jgi:hypothetical protein
MRIRYQVQIDPTRWSTLSMQERTQLYQSICCKLLTDAIDKLSESQLIQIFDIMVTMPRPNDINRPVEIEARINLPDNWIPITITNNNDNAL